ncbi:MULTISPECIES: hypothetical protein [unclassified Micromonospora]|uniref:hypothetical protein n=1 Tax=unclassified Micromonospora TaxID=2617518 RepID=UPI0033E329FF
MTDSTEHAATARAHAAAWFDKHFTLNGFTPMSPAELARRAEFIRAAEPRPGATVPPIATTCDSCGHSQIEELKWLGESGATALCIDALACKQRKGSNGGTS